MFPSIQPVPPSLHCWRKKRLLSRYPLLLLQQPQPQHHHPQRRLQRRSHRTTVMTTTTGWEISRQPVCCRCKNRLICWTASGGSCRTKNWSVASAHCTTPSPLLCAERKKWRGTMKKKNHRERKQPVRRLSVLLPPLQGSEGAEAISLSSFEIARRTTIWADRFSCFVFFFFKCFTPHHINNIIVIAMPSRPSQSIQRTSLCRVLVEDRGEAKGTVRLHRNDHLFSALLVASLLLVHAEKQPTVDGNFLYL